MKNELPLKQQELPADWNYLTGKWPKLPGAAETENSRDELSEQKNDLLTIHSFNSTSFHLYDLFTTKGKD